MIIPNVVTRGERGEMVSDIYSSLLDKRIIFLGGEINDDVANAVVAELLFLESQDPNKDIYLYINSPGGSVTAGLAIFDTMNYIKCDVSTICIGLAASMGAFLLSAGTKGKRFSLPNSEIMIHQASGGAQGQIEDVLIHTRLLADLNEKLIKIIAENCNKSYEQVLNDIHRDRFMTADEALEYGLIDKIVSNK